MENTALLAPHSVRTVRLCCQTPRYSDSPSHGPRLQSRKKALLILCSLLPATDTRVCGKEFFSADSQFSFAKRPPLFYSPHPRSESMKFPLPGYLRESESNLWGLDTTPVASRASRARYLSWVCLCLWPSVSRGFTLGPGINQVRTVIASGQSP